MSRSDVLNRILATKRDEVASKKATHGDDVIEVHARSMPEPRDFAGALRLRQTNQHPAVIAEIKRASPSKGLIREDFDVADLAQSYQEGGAACLSVLTDTPYFQGADGFLITAKKACDLPVLRKDFLIDPWQVHESRSLGADCILLIVSALDDASLHQMAELALDYGMSVLVETHDADELTRALALPNDVLIGVNNRDLKTFTVDLHNSIRLREQLPVDRWLIAESGIHTQEDVALLRDAGIHSYLIGERLMRADNPGAALSDLFGIGA